MVLKQEGQAAIGIDIMDFNGVNFMARSAQYAPVKAGTVIAQLKAGHYIIVPNTFQVGLLGKFTLDVYARKPIEFTLAKKQEGIVKDDPKKPVKKNY